MSRQPDLADAQQKLNNLNLAIKQKRAELVGLTADVNDLKAYHNAQKMQVDNAIQEWSAQLREFVHEIKLTVDEKNKLLRDVDNLEQIKSSFERDIKALEDKKATLELTYQTTASSYRIELTDLRTQIDIARLTTAS